MAITASFRPNHKIFAAELNETIKYIFLSHKNSQRIATICSKFFFYQRMMIKIFMKRNGLEVKTSVCQAGGPGFDSR
jgi:hypothetical protein